MVIAKAHVGGYSKSPERQVLCTYLLFAGRVLTREGLLTRADREALDRFPAVVDPNDVDRCFWLTEWDRREVVTRRYSAAGRLSAGLQIGGLRLLGFVPSELLSAPEEVIGFVAGQVGAEVGGGYVLGGVSCRGSHAVHGTPRSRRSVPWAVVPLSPAGPATGSFPVATYTLLCRSNG